MNETEREDWLKKRCSCGKRPVGVIFNGQRASSEVSIPVHVKGTTMVLTETHTLTGCVGVRRLPKKQES